MSSIGKQSHRTAEPVDVGQLANLQEPALNHMYVDPEEQPMIILRRERIREASLRSAGNSGSLNLEATGSPDIVEHSSAPASINSNSSLPTASSASDFPASPPFQVLGSDGSTESLAAALNT